MSLERPNFLREVIEPAEGQSMEQIVDKLVSDREDLVAAFGEAQKFGLVFKTKKEAIPPNLVEFINILAKRPSGFTGLTVWEYYSYREFKS